MIWKDFCLGIVMVRRSGDQMEFWLGDQKKDVARSNRWVRGLEMCGLGTWWDWWTVGFSDISK